MNHAAGATERREGSFGTGEGVGVHGQSSGLHGLGVRGVVADAGVYETATGDGSTGVLGDGRSTACPAATSTATASEWAASPRRLVDAGASSAARRHSFACCHRAPQVTHIRARPPTSLSTLRTGSGSAKAGPPGTSSPELFADRRRGLRRGPRPSGRSTFASRLIGTRRRRTSGGRTVRPT